MVATVEAKHTAILFQSLESTPISLFSSFSNTNPLFDSVGICLHALGMPFREVSFAEPPSNRLLNFDVDFVSPSCILPTREWR